LPVESAPEIQPEVQTPVVEEEVKDELPAEPQQPEDAPSAETLEAQEEVLERAVSPDEPSVDPSKAIPPTADDVEALNDLPTPATNGTEEHKAPQVVHLPPREVQEARLEETEHKLEKAREKEKREEERLALPNSASAPDAASSPSSTVGPYSQATPRAPNHSPVTSPDTETFQDNVPQSAQEDLEGDLAAQQAKEEHERALQRQMQEARERTRAESSDAPEVERQLEDEQAIRLARDGKSHLYESQPRTEPHSLTEQAEEVAQAVVPQAAPVIEEKPMTEPAADSLPTPTTTTAPEPAPMDPETTDDVPDEAQVTAPAVVEQPTPPEDVDVEMDDSLLPAEAQEKAATQTEPTQPDHVIGHISPERTQQKNVPELIEEKAATEAVLAPRSSNLSGTLSSPARPRATDHTAKPLTTVIFAKQDANRSAKALHLYSEEYAGLQGASQDTGRDYLEGLFQYQAHHPPRSAPLADLVAQARKTVSTAGTLAMIREAQDYKILKRVYQLQNANRWSLRQLQKSAEPPRPVCHQDHLLKEMKWMSTDFREERKWKKALAASFAEWCAEYVNGSPEVQASLRVRSYIPKHARQLSGADEDMNDAPTPELIPSGLNEIESESVDDDDLLSSFGANPPAGLFSLGFNDVVMKIDWTPASEAMLQELPSYEPLLEGAPDVTPVSFCDPPILPVSKFITGKLVSKVRGPPRKRSRYEYDSEDEPSSPPSRSGTSAEHSMPSTPGRRLYHRNDLPAEMTDVALFNPENKHVRDRLQAAHQFRPPTEFPMPSVSFFENRQSSQWLWEEDQKLRGLVKEYTFNWSLVAQQLALPSMYVSGSGRRTPWECFERWVQLEGLPAEMSKTQYFRTYQTRLEQAQRTVTAQHQAQQQLLQQQAQQGQAISGQARRRTTQPIRVERRRENRHLAIIDGMRKLARKRESIAHKQAECKSINVLSHILGTANTRVAQKAAQLRKAHEPAPPKSNVHTPQEFSRLKWEREEKMKQKMQMQQELNMRVRSTCEPLIT
jgi:chromatin modification-related protein VID21